MIIRDQWNEAVVAVKDNFLIYDDRLETDLNHTIMVKTGFQENPVVLGVYSDSEQAQRVIIEIYEAYNKGFPYVMISED